MKSFTLGNNNYELIIFDLDGTFYPSSVYIQKYYEFALETLVEIFRFPKEQAASILEANGITSDGSSSLGSVSTVIASLGRPLDWWNSYRDEHFSIVDDIDANPPLAEMIRRLAVDYKLAIVTNNTSFAATKILAKLGVDAEWFDLIQTSDSQQGLKPVSESYLHVIKTLNVLAANVLVFGDRYHVDILPIVELGGNGVLIDLPEDIISYSNEHLT